MLKTATLPLNILKKKAWGMPASRLVVICLGIAVLPLSGGAQANCERYEFAELKAMDAEKLKLNYCLNAIEIDRQKQRQKTAAQLSAIELKNPMGISRRELSKNASDDSLAEEKLGQCRHENERILSVLGQKKVNKLALMKECPSQ